MLEVRGLHVSYGDIAAVRGIDFRVETGEIVALVGANGAGKTTTLRTIAGALRARSGEIVFDGRPLGPRVPPHVRVRRGLVLVPEGRGILGRMSVEENLQMGAFPRRHVPARELQTIYERFPVLHSKRRLGASLLSGGEQQLLAIGRALLAAPRLLMLDEPSLGLAPLMVRTVFKAIEELHRAGITIVLVEQKAHQTLALAQRIYVMETGRIVAGGTATELARNSALSDAFLGAPSTQIPATS